MCRIVDKIDADIIFDLPNVMTLVFFHMLTLLSLLFILLLQILFVVCNL